MANEITVDLETFRYCNDCDVYFNATYVGATCPCCEAEALADAKEEARQDLSDRLHDAENEIHHLTNGVDYV
jgi:hypothetical protein